MKRVLLIDEHNLFRQILALVLNRTTVLKESLQASSLAEARQVLANSNHKPDLAIVDLDLSSGGRFELLIRELRMIVPDVPVIAITLRQGDAQRREWALRAGADELLTMAAPPKEIVEVANRLIGE